MRVTGQVEANRRELIDPRFALPGELARGVPDAVLRRIREDPDRLERRAAEALSVETERGEL